MEYRALAQELVGMRAELRRAGVERLVDRMAAGEQGALFLLLQDGEIAHPKDLSERMGVSTARVATMLGHLEERGLLTRSPTRLTTGRRWWPSPTGASPTSPSAATKHSASSRSCSNASVPRTRRSTCAFRRSSSPVWPRKPSTNVGERTSPLEMFELVFAAAGRGARFHRARPDDCRALSLPLVQNLSPRRGDHSC